MMVSLFDQFMSPVVLGIPLVTLALLLPWLLLPTAPKKWIKDRLLSLEGRVIQVATRQLFSPVSTGGHKWAMIIATLLVYLIFLNTLGLLPYTYTPTTQLSLNLGLAVPLWLATLLIGMREHPTRTLGHLLPEGTPNALIPILIVIETVSLFIRPLALGVRLTANLTAGHLLIHLIGGATFYLITAMPVVALMAETLMLLMTVLEIAVALIQAYVFVLLLTLYLQENV